MIEGDDQCIWNLEILFSCLWRVMQPSEAYASIENDMWDPILLNLASTTMLIHSKAYPQVSQLLRTFNTFVSSSLHLLNLLLGLTLNTPNPSTSMDR